MSLDPLYANIVTKTSQYSLKLIKEEARRARMAVIATDPIPLPLALMFSQEQWVYHVHIDLVLY